MVFFDKKNYVGGEKIMILTNRTGKGNEKDKVKDIKEAVSAVFIVCSSEHTAIKSLYMQVQ